VLDLNMILSRMPELRRAEDEIIAEE